jgi:hypothetical protein
MWGTQIGGGTTAGPSTALRSVQDDNKDGVEQKEN